MRDEVSGMRRTANRLILSNDVRGDGVTSERCGLTIVSTDTRCRKIFFVSTTTAVEEEGEEEGWSGLVVLVVGKERSTWIA